MSLNNDEMRPKIGQRLLYDRFMAIVRNRITTRQFDHEGYAMHTRPAQTVMLTLTLLFATAAMAVDWSAADLNRAIAGNPGRPPADAARDGGRKPGQVLSFLGVQKGMTVLDLIAAGGWYSEALSVAVGPHGKVYAQNPPGLLQMRDGVFEKEISARLAAGRLANVERLNADLPAMNLAPGSIDFALTALNFHDVYNRRGEDAAVGMMKLIFQALKPGASFGVIDHCGAAGNDNVQLHRIERSIVEAAASKAGFELAADSQLLRNPQDALDKNVFDPAIRGHTDRFLLRLEKPGHG